MLSAMAYFLEYTTGIGVGRFVVEGSDFSNALAKAKEELRGLDCIKAALRYCPVPVPESAFGSGSILAVYTQANGWVIPPNDVPSERSTPALLES